METRLYDTPGVYGALAHSCRSSKMVIGCGDKRLKVMVFMGIHHQKKTERENGCIISLGDIMTVSFCQLLSASTPIVIHWYLLISYQLMWIFMTFNHHQIYQLIQAVIN